MADLIPIQNPDLPTLFAPGGLDKILEKVEQDAISLVPDTSTEKGRKEIASRAHRVARSKTYLDGLGKDLVSELRDRVASVDRVRKAMRERLDDLKAKVRRPLDEWESDEKARKAAIERRISSILEPLTGSADEIDAELRELEAFVIDDSFHEFKDRAQLALDAAIARGHQALKQARIAEETERERREAARIRMQERAEAARREEQSRTGEARAAPDPQGQTEMPPDENLPPRESQVGYPTAAADNTRTKYTDQGTLLRADLGSGIHATVTPDAIVLTYGTNIMRLTRSDWLRICKLAAQADYYFPISLFRAAS